MSGNFKTWLFTADTISYIQDLLVKDTWGVIFQEHDINEILNNFWRICLNIFESSFPVIYHDKLKDNACIKQGASQYHVKGKAVCFFLVEIIMSWNWKYATNIIVLFWEEFVETKILYYNELKAKWENKVKITWKIIKNSTGKNQNSQNVSPTFKVDGIE